MELWSFRPKRSFEPRRRAFGQHQIIRRTFGVAGNAEIGPEADDRLAFGVGVAALPGGAAVGIGAVHAGHDHVGPIERRDVHLEDRLGGVAARLVLLRQPDLKALAFEKSREFNIEVLLGQGEQRAGEIDFRHGLLQIHSAPPSRTGKASRSRDADAPELC